MSKTLVIYDPTTGGFYPTGATTAGVVIDSDEYLRLMRGQEEGAQEIRPSKSGAPMLTRPGAAYETWDPTIEGWVVDTRAAEAHDAAERAAAIEELTEVAGNAFIRMQGAEALYGVESKEYEIAKQTVDGARARLKKLNDTEGGKQ